MIIFVSVSMFDRKPEHRPFSHSLWPGMAQVRLALTTRNIPQRELYSGIVR
jgi:hypothetical protein